MKKIIVTTTLITATVLAGAGLYNMQASTPASSQNNELTSQTFEGTLEDALIDNVVDVTNKTKNTAKATTVTTVEETSSIQEPQASNSEPVANEPSTAQEPVNEPSVVVTPPAPAPTPVVVEYELTQVDEKNWNCTYTYSDGSTHTFLHKTLFPNYTRRVGVCSNLAIGIEKAN